MKEPNWIITAIIGAILGFIPDIFRIFKYTILRFTKNRIVGNWYVYEFTKSEGNIKRTKGICRIKNGILNRFSIIMQNDNLLYKGTGDCEDNHLFMMIKNKNDKLVRKETCWQRYDFSYNDYNYLLGLWLSNDYDGHTTCGISILSRTELNETEINNIISNKYNIDNQIINIDINRKYV